MKKTADVIVVGLGAHGSASLYQLAKRGVDVIGFDQFATPHAHGSHGGETRITRLATGEGAEYTGFARRSHEIWSELEESLDRKYKPYLKTGGLVIGEKDSVLAFHGKRNFLSSTIKAAEMCNIPHRILSAEDIRQEFPLFKIADDESGYFEPDAGVLFPSECIAAHLEAADRCGGKIHMGVTVHNICKEGSGVRLNSSAGEFYAKNCIITAGAFVRSFLPERYRKLFKIVRQVMYWYEPREFADQYVVGKFPIYIWERAGIYGFPDLGSGLVKVALGERTDETDPMQVDRIVSEAEYAELEKVLSLSIPSLNGVRTKAATCLYTQTPDNDFVIDRHPDMWNVWVVSACSGHGFKHSAAIGELMAEIIKPEHPNDDLNLTPFGWDRFKNVL